MSSISTRSHRLCAQLAKLPGVGRKSAQRHGVLSSSPSRRIRCRLWPMPSPPPAPRFTTAAICGNYTDQDICSICADERRDGSTLCVVRDPRDVAAIERMRDYNGKYHVLHGIISPMEGIGPDDIRIRELMARLNGSSRSDPGHQPRHRRRGHCSLYCAAAQALYRHQGHAHRARRTHRRRPGVYRRGHALPRHSRPYRVLMQAFKPV